MVFLAISILEGVWAYFAIGLRRILKPVYVKFTHNLTSLICFTTGMVSLIYGYQYGDTHDVFLTKDVEYTLVGIAIFTTIFSMIGALKSVYAFLKGVCE